MVCKKRPDGGEESKRVKVCGDPGEWYASSGQILIPNPGMGDGFYFVARA